MCNSAQQTSDMTKEEDIQMKENNTTDVPKWAVNPKNAILAALHVLILIVSLMVHPPVKTSAARALP